MVSENLEAKFLPEQLRRIMNSVASGLPHQPMNQLLDVRSYKHSSVLLLFLLIVIVLIILLVYTTCFLGRKENMAEPLPLHSDNGCHPSPLPILPYKFVAKHDAAAKQAVCWSLAEDDETDMVLPESKYGIHNWCIDPCLTSCSTWLAFQTPVASAEEGKDWGLETSDQMLEGALCRKMSAGEVSNMEARTSFACHSQMPADDFHFSLLLSWISS